MNKKSILFMENDRAYLAANAAFLESRGYDVLPAQTVAKAEQLLRAHPFHLMLCDIRMEEDTDPNDISGLTLAKRSDLRFLPKIMLTSDQGISRVKEAMVPDENGIPAAWDYILKNEAHKRLVPSIEKVLSEHDPINGKLRFHFSKNTPGGFIQLAHLLSRGARQEELLQRAQDLEYLFRRHLPTIASLRVDRLLWVRENRLALTGYLFWDDGNREARILVCGSREAIRGEKVGYDDHGPNFMTAPLPKLRRHSESMVHGVLTYALEEADFEAVVTFKAELQLLPNDQIEGRARVLAMETLEAWEQNKRFVSKDLPLQWYRRRFKNKNSLAPFMAFLDKVGHEFGLVIDSEKQRLVLKVGSIQESLPLPNALLTAEPQADFELTLVPAPEHIDFDQILVYGKRHWITDLRGAGEYYPEGWTLAGFEAGFLFEVASGVPHAELFAFSKSHPQVPARSGDKLVPSLIRMNAGIRAVRSLVQERNIDFRAYILALYFQILDRLATFDPEIPALPNEKKVVFHLAVIASRCCRQFEKSEEQSEHRGCSFDQSQGLITCGPWSQTFTEQPFRILEYLYKENRIVSRQELGEHLFGPDYRSEEKADISRLNTAINRTRTALEEAPNCPLTLRTVKGKGYLLK